MKYLLFFTVIVYFSSCHFAKSIIYLRPDHKDGNKFPKHEIAASFECTDLPFAKQSLDISKLLITFKDGHQEYLNHIFENHVTNTFIIIRKGRVLSEHYYNDYNELKPHSSFSVSKGMLASMLGLTIQEDLIHDLNDAITNYIPELLELDSAFANITIHHLLDMNSGIKLRGRDASFFGDLAKTYYGNNWQRFMSTIEIDTLPGGKHRYNQTDPQLLSVIISRVTGQSLSDYFSEKIWSKLGTEKAYWSIFTKDEIEKGFCCFNARPLDYAKFALLYLQRGKWQGEQIIPESWVEFTTTRKDTIPSEYIYSFNKYWFPANDGKADYTMQGYNGQMIYVNPTREIIILRFAKKEEKEIIDWERVMREIDSQIL